MRADELQRRAVLPGEGLRAAEAATPVATVTATLEVFALETAMLGGFSEQVEFCGAPVQ